jgi:hypothetical protein
LAWVFSARIGTSVDAFAFILSKGRQEGEYPLPNWCCEIQPLVIQYFDCSEPFVHALHEIASCGLRDEASGAIRES